MRLYIAMFIVLLAGCNQQANELTGVDSPVPARFEFTARTTPCYLEVNSPPPRAIRVNCFEIDGTLHIHSNRFSRLPRPRGESWVDTARRDPRVRVAIDGKIYRLQATLIADESQRRAILEQRGYWIAWNGIRLFSFR